MANMPRYQSHKIIRALQIKEVVRRIRHDVNDMDVTLRFVEEGHADVTLPASMFARYFPKPLDYYVVYDNPDGSEYASISPRETFEAGYTKLP